MIEFVECRDRETLIDRLVDAVTQQLQQALLRPGKITLVVSGGRTPGPAYAKLSSANVDWSRIRILLSDDRMVPVTSPYSNEGLVRATLLQGHAAQAEYIRLKPGSIGPDLLPFDVTVLGMGEDGHIASLFPVFRRFCDPFDTGIPPRCVMVTPDPLPVEAPFPRLTLNLTALLASRLFLVVLTGLVKRQVFERALMGDFVKDVPIGALLRQRSAPFKVYWAP